MDGPVCMPLNSRHKLVKQKNPFKGFVFAKVLSSFVLDDSLPGSVS